MRQAEGEDEVARIGPEQTDERNRHNERGHTEEEIERRRYDAVGKAVQGCRERPDENPPDSRDRHDDERERDADAPAVEQAREFVAPELIRTERMRRRIRRKAHRQILRIGITGRKIRRTHDDEHPHEQQRPDDAKIAAVQEARPKESHSCRAPFACKRRGSSHSESTSATKFAATKTPAPHSTYACMS